MLGMYSSSSVTIMRLSFTTSVRIPTQEPSSSTLSSEHTT